MMVKAQTQTVTMTIQVLIVLTTMHTSLSTQFTQCLGSQTLGQEMAKKLALQQILRHTRTRTCNAHTHTHTPRARTL